MQKLIQWYDFESGQHTKVRFPKMRTNLGEKLEMAVPCRPNGIWKEGEFIFMLYVCTKYLTSKVIKYNLEGYPQNEISWELLVLEKRWDLKKHFHEYSTKEQFNMTLNRLTDKGELIQCI